ncbi:MAG: polysaccharide deacetylase family protein [Bacteroidetes bacterium]|nr:polysaccharide deacetylase family protein [Bacteroidota bacterium]
MFYLVRPPWLVKKYLSEAIWEIDTPENELFLTFDDGPHPEVTPFVLEQLKIYDARATFFCVGSNVQKYFEVYKQIINEGHAVGNHTFNHLNAWKVGDKKYLDDISKARKIIDSELFRPPYGRISRFLINALKGKNYNLTTIMWSALSGDFDPSIKADECFLNVSHHAKKGAVIVFHDSAKSFPILKEVLPRVLQYCKAQQLGFGKISLNHLQKNGPE